MGWAGDLPEANPVAADVNENTIARNLRAMVSFILHVAPISPRTYRVL